MRIEVLEKSKIKVTLTFEDFIYHNLKPEQLSAQSPSLHKFLFSVMESVRQETGFNPYKGPVAIEAIQSKDGMVLYITGIKDRAEAGRRVVVKGVEKRVKVHVGKNIISENRYRFKDFSALCDALMQLGEASLNASGLYEYKNEWYYVHKSNEDFEKAHCILSEYCSEFGSTVASETFLTEHGKLIAECEKLTAMAEGIKKLG